MISGGACGDIGGPQSSRLTSEGLLQSIFEVRVLAQLQALMHDGQCTKKGIVGEHCQEPLVLFRGTGLEGAKTRELPVTL